MSKRELISQEIGRLSDRDLDRLLAYLHLLGEAHEESVIPAMASEPSLARDWLSSEEEAAWANL